MVTIKNESEIENMRTAGKIIIEIFDLLEKEIAPGKSTKHLDKIVYEYIISSGGKPSFYKYQGFPASICTSVDDAIIHGIPTESEILQEGQIIGIDVGVKFNGFHADAARTYAVGKISPEKQRLIDITRESFFEGVKTIKSGTRVGDIGHAIQKYAEKNGFSVVREFVGHGVGRELHEEPSVPNYGLKGSGIRLTKGMTIAIEPMINIGSYQIRLVDTWGVRTRDGSPSAHYENTVVVTETGAEILTLRG